MIEYRTDKQFEEQQLKVLFESVGWISANYSERLVKALENSDTVISAWDNENLIGLVNAIDDGELTAETKELLLFYQKMGFNVVEGAVPMVLQTL